MSGITNPIETFFKSGIWGWCVNQWKQLVCDAAGHLQIDVVTSGLPAGAATAANQATMITALQLVDDLRGALDSIATDELLVNFHEQDADVEVTQTAPADLVVGNYGWDGAAWHKLAMLWGYSDRWQQTCTGTAVGAGHVIVTTTPVSAGYVYVLQRVALWHNAAAAKIVSIDLLAPPAATNIYHDVTLAPGVFHPFVCEAVLKEDDYVQGVCSSPGDARSFSMAVWGYKMRVAE